MTDERTRVTEELELRTISPEAVPNAIEKAKHYRLLNQPAEAESICRDVLDVQPDNQEAMIVLVLSMTDRFGQGATSGGSGGAQAVAAELTDPYHRAYYGGIVRERQARALMQKGMASAFAYDGFREAMDWYQNAHAVRPEGDDDATLRWNSCVRAIRSNRLRPRVEEVELPLE